MATQAQKTTEVIVVISPRSGEDDTLFRVTIGEKQLRDVLENASYGEIVFGIFKGEACKRLELNPNECDIGLIEEDDQAGCGTYTATVTDGIFLLH